VKSRHVCAAACCIVFFILVCVSAAFAQQLPAQHLSAQQWIALATAAQPAAGTTGVLRHVGAVQDWTDRQIVFSQSGLEKHPELLLQEPRIRQQLLQRLGAWGAKMPSAKIPNTPQEKSGGSKSGMGRDWSVGGLGARMRVNEFPAKYTFDPTAPPNCTDDYVVFALAVAGTTGSGGQANLIAFNNLYVNDDGSGFCTGLTAPTVLFAYNASTIGGKLVTSPVLSLDGSQIAFVESLPGTTPASVFHVVNWTAQVGGQGTIAAPVAPTSETSFQYSTFGNLTSAPWVDYGADIAYVGDNDGNLSEISPVFNGTPNIVASVAVSSGYELTPPVEDISQGLLMVGSVDGDLYQVNFGVTPITVVPLVVGALGDTSPGVYAPPIVDPSNNWTYAVTPDAGANIGAELIQVETSTNTSPTIASIGLGASSAPPGNTGTKMHLYQPAFSNGYFTSPVDGVISICGTGASDTTPNQYEFGFNGFTGTMKTTPQSGYPLQLSAVDTDTCTGWIEFFNPFAGVTDPITAVDLIANILVVTTNNDFAVGDTVYLQGTDESFLNGQAVTVTGLIGTAPHYTGFTADFTYNGIVENPTDTGAAGLGTDFFFFGLLTDCTSSVVGGVGGQTDGCVVSMTSVSTTTPSSAPVTGGPSGIVVDNYSTAAETSSIYLSSTSANLVYKFTQYQLQ
jgi:hypothetical protein